MSGANSVLAEALRDGPFHDLDMDTKSRILSRWVETNNEMNRAGQKKPVWDGEMTMQDIVLREVVAKTDRGEMVGKAIYFTIIPDHDGIYKQAVLVHVPGSGSVVTVPGRNVRLAAADDKERMNNEVTFARKLEQVGEGIEEIVITKRASRVSGSHLLNQMIDAAKDMKLIVEDKSGWYVISGNKKGVACILSQKGGKAHLRGFSIEEAGVKQVTEEEAKARHIGKVRGEIDFDREDAVVLAAWQKALGTLG